MKPLLLVLVPLLLVQAAVVFAQPASDADKEALVKGNNTFALDLYGQLRQQDGNLFFSPASISTAFAMAYGGASGSTATEMAATLHFTLPPDRLHPAMGALLTSLNASHSGYQLHVADALWAEKDETFLPGFLKLTKANYAAGFHPVDFKHQAEPVRETINKWVEEQTANKIKDLLAAGSVNANTRMVLTNAIYFKGDWEFKFDKASTHDEDFHLSADKTVKVPMMHLSESYGYFGGPSFQEVELPYKSGELSMVILLPHTYDGLPALEQSLTEANLHEWLGDMTSRSKIVLSLPRFTMTQKFTLNRTLAALGMKQAFEQESADFSGMTGHRDLFISDAIHKAFIDVNEEGTEAAAATAMTFRATAMAYQPPPIVVRIDRPFLFLILDRKSGGILFMGRVLDPTK